MSQATSRTGGQVISLLSASNGPVAIPATGNTVVLTVPVAGLTNLGVHVTVAEHALDAFAIAARFHPDGAFVTLYNTAGAFTSPAGLLIGASGDLTTQAVGSGWFIMDVRGLYEVQVSASGTVDDTTAVTIYAGGS